MSVYVFARNNSKRIEARIANFGTHDVLWHSVAEAP